MTKKTGPEAETHAGELDKIVDDIEEAVIGGDAAFARQRIDDLRDSLVASSRPLSPYREIARKFYNAITGSGMAGMFNAKLAEEAANEFTDAELASRPLSEGIVGPVELTKDEQAALLSTMDGMEWAKAFCRVTGFADVSWALTWFCSAIMAGYDEANRRRDRSETPSAATWQPIETAPKETLVLVHDDGYVGKAMLLKSGDWLDTEAGTEDALFRPAPQHWMPLPDPPKADPVSPSLDQEKPNEARSK